MYSVAEWVSSKVQKKEAASTELATKKLVNQLNSPAAVTPTLQKLA